MLRDYQPVTAERLKNPEPANWLQIRGQYSGWGYSELDQINTRNVKQLQLAWAFATGATGEHEAAPLVNNGVMYITAPGNQVLAINAQTGTLLWRYRKDLPAAAIVMHPTNRGVALFGNTVYFASQAAVLIALDAKTGKEIWSTTVDDNKKAYYMTGAPLIADGKVIVGVSGGEWGIRGSVVAFDLDTGKEIWRTYTIPAPGEPGSETWPNKDEWKTGGGPTWVTGNYDPATNLIYWGVGNGGPWMGDLRPGDNLYTASTLALNASTGKIVGYHQYDPNESFDWDEVSPPLLIDFKRAGKPVKGLVDVARDGYMFYLERTAQGPINFVDANPYVLQTAFKGVDPKTGQIEYNEEHKPVSGKTTDFCPMTVGAKNWQYAAFSPKTRMIYIPTSANLCSSSTGTKPEYRAEQPIPADIVNTLSTWAPITSERPRRGMSIPAKRLVLQLHPLPQTGARCWRQPVDWHLAAAHPIACSAPSMHRSPANCRGRCPPLQAYWASSSTFMVDGKQYVAVVMTGWGGDPRGVQARMYALRPGEFPEVPEGGAIWVFTLPSGK